MTKWIKKESYCPNALMTYCLMQKKKERIEELMKNRRNVLTNAGGGGASLNRHY